MWSFLFSPRSSTGDAARESEWVELWRHIHRTPANPGDLRRIVALPQTPWIARWNLLTEAVVGWLGPDSGTTIWIPETIPGSLWVAAHAGIFHQGLVGWGEGPVGLAARERSNQWFEGLSAESELPYPVRQILAIPVLVAGQLALVWEVRHRQPDGLGLVEAEELVQIAALMSEELKQEQMGGHR